MDNNVNNNVDSTMNTNTDVNVSNVQPSVIPVSTESASVQPIINSVDTASVQPIVSPATNIVTGDSGVVSDASAMTNTSVDTSATTVMNATNTETVQPVVNVASPNVGATATVQANTASTVNTANTNTGNQNNGDDNQKNYKKLYIMMGIIVGGVLLIAAILLIFLLNGGIENRNRLTCTKTTQEDGYSYHVKRYYTFDNKVMKRVYFTHTFTYDSEVTDDFYNQTFDKIINNDTHGVTEYGLQTNISREGNVVTITSYEVNYWEDEISDIKKQNKDEGYTCE